jgi:microcystin-dependent protein
MKYSDLEIKVKGFLKTPLTAETSTSAIDVDFFYEDDTSTPVTLQSDTLMFEIDPLNKTGKRSEICLATTNSADTPVADRTRFNTVTRGLPRYGQTQTADISMSNSWDEGTEVAIATGSMAKVVNKLVSEVGTRFPLDAGALQLPVYADATARDAAILAPSNGMLIYNIGLGIIQQYIGGSWQNNASGTTVDAADHTAGKVDIASATEIGANTNIDPISGAINVIPVVQTVKTSTAVTPAFLTGDTGAQSTPTTWAAVTDGSFGITIDEVAYNVDAINFTGVASMANVATVIQTALRAKTGQTETVTWSTDHFIITSSNTSHFSAITVLRTSTGTVGTDISGAGASDWMDCDTGNGVVTNYVSADENKLPVYNSYGELDSEFIPHTGLVGEIKMWITSTAPFGWLLLEGGTIGDASSAATSRANADTKTLYKLLWNNFADAQLAVTGGRGSNSEADFNAHKEIALPDFRGRVPVGKDSGTFNLNGKLVGEETHTLSVAELASHTHSTIVHSGGGVSNALEQLLGVGTTTVTAYLGSAGSDSPHNNIQPSIVTRFIIKY